MRICFGTATMNLKVQDTFGREHAIVATSDHGERPRWFLVEGYRELVRIDEDVLMVMDQPNAAPLRVLRGDRDDPVSA